MQCPFFREMTIEYCVAFSKRIFIPSESEKGEYCLSESYHKCSKHQEYMRNKKKDVS